MGTNYFYHEPDRNHCHHCGRCDRGRVLHIGKSSVGWCFALHVTEDIRSLEDWQRKWSEPGGRIVDEYGREYTPEDMLAVITERSCHTRGDPPYGYASHEQAMRENQAAPGPNGLWRHAGSSCVGHGPGTWDLIEGEFS